MRPGKDIFHQQAGFVRVKSIVLVPHAASVEGDGCEVRVVGEIPHPVGVDGIGVGFSVTGSDEGETVLIDRTGAFPVAVIAELLVIAQIGFQITAMG